MPRARRRRVRVVPGTQRRPRRRTGRGDGRGPRGGARGPGGDIFGRLPAGPLACQARPRPLPRRHLPGVRDARQLPGGGRRAAADGRVRCAVARRAAPARVPFDRARGGGGREGRPGGGRALHHVRGSGCKRLHRRLRPGGGRRACRGGRRRRRDGVGRRRGGRRRGHFVGRDLGLPRGGKGGAAAAGGGGNDRGAAVQAPRRIRGGRRRRRQALGGQEHLLQRRHARDGRNCRQGRGLPVHDHRPERARGTLRCPRRGPGPCARTAPLGITARPRRATQTPAARAPQGCGRTRAGRLRGQGQGQ